MAKIEQKVTGWVAYVGPYESTPKKTKKAAERWAKRMEKAISEPQSSDVAQTVSSDQPHSSVSEEAPQSSKSKRK